MGWGLQCGKVALRLTPGSTHGCPLRGLKDWGHRTEVSVLPGDVACRVLVTDIIFNKPSFLRWFPNKKKNRLLVQCKVTLSAHNTELLQEISVLSLGKALHIPK